MTDLTIIVVIAMVLLAVLAIAGRRSGESGELTDSDYDVRLPSRAVLDRCLSLHDIEFASTIQSPAVLRLLLSERRRLTLCWLRQTRVEAGRLFRLHGRAARHARNLRPAAEFKLLLSFAALVLVYRLLAVAVLFYGPLHTGGFLRSVRSLSNVLANLGGLVAASAAPAQLPAGLAAR
jgi:hypothetical protein